MIEYAARVSGVLVTITTNGTIMNEKRTRRLLESGVHLIDISIDAFKPDTYSKIRVNGDLEITRTNVLSLLRWIRETGARTKVVVSFIEQPGNAAEIDDFTRFWTDQGAYRVVIRRLHSAAGAVVNIARLLRNKAKHEHRYPCLYPWERITINPRGELVFCPQDWVHGSVVADFRESSIRETWQGEFYQKLRNAHLTNDFGSHAFCGQCPDWRSTRWPDQGRSYADMVEDLKTER